MDNSIIHGHFVGTKVLSSWTTFFKIDRATFLVIWITLLRISEARLDDTLTFAYEGIIFDEAQVIVDSYDLDAIIHVL